MNNRRNDNRQDYRNSRRDNQNYYQNPSENNYAGNSYNPRNKTNPLIWVLLGVAGVAVAVGGYKIFTGSSQAQITNVSPHYVSTQEPYNTCHNVQTTRYVANQKDGTTGAIIGGATGAVAGGVIGNQVSHHGGSAIGAVIGGVSGAIIGDQVQKSQQPDYVAKHGSAKKCETKYRTVRGQQGFEVQYIYKDTPGKIITQNAPAVGSKIELTQLQAMAINSSN